MSQSVTAIVPRARQIVRRDPVLAIAAVLAVASCALVPPDAGYAGYVDFRTLGLLFSLMTVMAGLTRAGVFTAAGRALLARTHSGTGAIMALVLLPFVASMLVTNDVSLIAFVPFALLVLRMLGLGGTSVFTVVMMTIAANLGSMLTPIGNPQNLYLFSASGMGVGEFLLLMLPYAAVSGGLLVASVLLYGARHRGLPLSDAAGEKDLAPQEARIRRRALAPWAALFALSLLAVVRVVPVALLVPVVAIAALIIDRGALAEVDFGLLLTFVVFFVFVGNVGRMGAVNDLLASLVGGNELAVSVAASQVVSNVPAALLLSGFTSAWPALIVGTNLGGLGTLIASMASLISYKQVVESEPDAAGRYLVRFTIANVAFLAALALLALLLF
ncbi:SLC13 family permease [Thermophilibacter provencensis]|uniref:SLC13 family permease n=1 Tax=Thermophilibacter provencensis TaxID=1852386 RepID=A0ABT7V3B0_9ACTN|nr:SLC13 family permease [Thermophilibacter provencensis]MDM8271079.1 SLC13 family permease [Thermophilibacter provencensis]